MKRHHVWRHASDIEQLRKRCCTSFCSHAVTQVERITEDGLQMSRAKEEMMTFYFCDHHAETSRSCTDPNDIEFADDW